MRVPGRQRTTRDAGLSVQHRIERQLRSVRVAVDLVEVHVVEARGVLQQVDHANGIGRLPGVVDLQLRRDFEDRRIEIDVAIEIQLDHRRGDEGLADRTGAEMRVGRYRRIAGAVGDADATCPFDA